MIMIMRFPREALWHITTSVPASLISSSSILNLEESSMEFYSYQQRLLRYSTVDIVTNIRRGAQTFNSFVNPGDGAIYREYMVTIHRLHASHPSIM